jgi:hypothetical protein
MARKEFNEKSFILALNMCWDEEAWNTQMRGDRKGILMDVNIKISVEWKLRKQRFFHSIHFAESKWLFWVSIVSTPLHGNLSPVGCNL